MVHVEGGAVREAEEAPRGRVRTCVGCGERIEGDAGDLIRLVLGPEGEIAVDARGGAFGRGAHVHARPACLDRAARSGLARSTKGKAATVLSEDGEALPLHAGSLARVIQEAMDRRIEGLFAAAVRSRQLAFGADAVTGACQRGDAALVVVARDAAAAAELTEVRRAVSEGRAVAWGDKQRLGRIVMTGKRPGGDSGGAGVGVTAILSPKLGDAVLLAVRIADGCTGAEAPRPRVARPVKKPGPQVQKAGAGADAGPGKRPKLRAGRNGGRTESRGERRGRQVDRSDGSVGSGRERGAR